MKIFDETTFSGMKINNYHIKKKCLSVLLVLILLFSSFSLPITLGAEPALASPSTTKLIYSSRDRKSFHEKFIDALGARNDIVVYTDFTNYSQFPNDLKEIIGKTKEDLFVLTPTQKYWKRWKSSSLGTAIGGTIGAGIGIIIGDPFDGAILGSAIVGSFWGIVFGSAVGYEYGELIANEHYGYIVTFTGRNIYLNAVSQP